MRNSTDCPQQLLFVCLFSRRVYTPFPPHRVFGSTSFLLERRQAHGQERERAIPYIGACFSQRFRRNSNKKKGSCIIPGLGLTEGIELFDDFLSIDYNRLSSVIAAPFPWT
jgi:hypothetical protein